MLKKISVPTIALLLLQIFILDAQSIPLPEHPRPDFERESWINLNGEWQFEFDSLDQGINEQWFSGHKEFTKQILVPFPWGSKLSGMANEADIAWYKKEINIDRAWDGQRIFLIIGASDWETTVWIDGHQVGSHQGGYVPIEFELTEFNDGVGSHTLVIRVDDRRRQFTLYGKQGYGDARGIWQTAYLEARPEQYLDAVHFTPDIDQQRVRAKIYLNSPATESLIVSLQINTGSGMLINQDTIPAGRETVTMTIPVPQQRLWTLKDPFLYETSISLGDDKVRSYFGMRKISVMNLPGTEHPYIALNNEPVYLQLALDQSYHPDGFYTFPSDEFMRDEILRSKSIGLNGIRPHIKVEVPRKLYWADKLGLLVMQDLPNSWGDPDERMQSESEYTLRQMVKRDFNHPSIFSWILFNETWGLRTTVENENGSSRMYLSETQNWVTSMYYLARSLDPTRLIEDNSICCGVGHVKTDIVSFHDYLAGWEWEEKLSDLTRFVRYYDMPSLFEEGYSYENQPIINSECGNVWGYDGSTGDVDWSYDYHRMINTFRQFPKIAGWLYTEHHDVINEWNGYWRFDRSEKYTGLGEIFEGMSLNDLHSPIYLSTGNEICKTVSGGDIVDIPLFISSMTSEDFGAEIALEYSLEMTNRAGETEILSSGKKSIKYRPWNQKALDPLAIVMPDNSGLALLKLQLLDESGKVLHRNFMHFVVEGQREPDNLQIISANANEISTSEWSRKQWEVMDGMKINGAGRGFFEYNFTIPDEILSNPSVKMYFVAELSAKELFAKDTLIGRDRDLNFMLGEKTAPSSNPNAYPMTDENTHPSEIAIFMNGVNVYETVLPDDPADHRGVLSWHAQLKDKKLREAGSYGYLTNVPITGQVLQKVKDENGLLIVRIHSKSLGGLAVYGKSFGRFPVDPSIIISKATQ